MNIKQTKIWRFLSSIRLAIWLLSIITLLSLIGTLIPQNKEPAEYIHRYGYPLYRLFSKLRLTDIYSTWWFILSLVFLSFNLITCLINRLSLKMRMLGSLLSHLSILIILAGALIGNIFGERGYIQISEGQSINSFLSKNKKVVNLDFSIYLDDFIYEEYVHPEERLLVYSNDGKLLDELAVKIGVSKEIKDTDFQIKILRYLPDFSMDISTKEVISKSYEPRNPALEIELTGREKKEKFWVFARYADIHQQTDKEFNFVYRWKPRRPKEFISKVSIIREGKKVLSKDIRVNFPLKFGGYTFFQSSFDKEHHKWSGLELVRDPGLPLVYTGFTLLILGLIIIFYLNPIIERRK